MEPGSQTHLADERDGIVRGQFPVKGSVLLDKKQVDVKGSVLLDKK